MCTACSRKESRGHGEFDGLIEAEDGILACIAFFQGGDLIFRQLRHEGFQGIPIQECLFHIEPHHVDDGIDDLVLGQNGGPKIFHQDGIHPILNLLQKGFAVCVCG